MKVAVLLTGFVRTLQDIYPSIKANILDKYDCEFFIQTWDIKNINRTDSEINSTKINQVIVRRMLPDWTPVQIKVENWNNYLSQRKPFEFHNRQNDIFKTDRRAAQHGLQYVNKIRDIWFLIKKGKDQIQEFEKNNGIKFDCIIKNRTDLPIHESLDIQLDENIYVISCDGEDVNDWFAYGRRDNMLTYLSLHDDLENLYIDKNIDVSYGERVLYHYLKNKNIQLKALTNTKWEIKRNSSNNEVINPIKKEILLQTNRWGTFLLPQWDYISKRITNGEFWDLQLKSIFDRFLTKESIVVEVGSNLGFHTVYLSKKCKYVFAFEPQKFTFHHLCANLFLNFCYNVKAFELACYDSCCYLDILHEVDYSTCENAAAIGFKPGNNDFFQAITIDSLNLAGCDLLKIDAQGSDFRCVKGAIKTINKYRPIIIFEHEPELLSNHNNTFDDFTHLLEKENNYNIKKIRLFQQEGNSGLSREIYQNGDYVAFPLEKKYDEK